ncbi:hypothetical protein CRUP_003722 [Coryphaenoides rupestris]|nr:hypothetical protein CRUP_003722 [Coryphaenoides rupestris]
MPCLHLLGCALQCSSQAGLDGRWSATWARLDWCHQGRMIRSKESDWLDSIQREHQSRPWALHRVLVDFAAGESWSDDGVDF